MKYCMLINELSSKKALCFECIIHITYESYSSHNYIVIRFVHLVHKWLPFLRPKTRHLSWTKYKLSSSLSIEPYVFISGWKYLIRKSRGTHFDARSGIYSFRMFGMVWLVIRSHPSASTSSQVYYCHFKNVMRGVESNLSEFNIIQFNENQF